MKSYTTLSLFARCNFFLLLELLVVGITILFEDFGLLFCFISLIALLYSMFYPVFANECLFFL